MGEWGGVGADSSGSQEVTYKDPPGPGGRWESRYLGLWVSGMRTCVLLASCAVQELTNAAVLQLTLYGVRSDKSLQCS